MDPHNLQTRNIPILGYRTSKKVRKVIHHLLIWSLVLFVAVLFMFEVPIGENFFLGIGYFTIVMVVILSVDYWFIKYLCQRKQSGFERFVARAISVLSYLSILLTVLIALAGDGCWGCDIIFGFIVLFLILGIVYHSIRYFAFENKEKKWKAYLLGPYFGLIASFCIFVYILFVLN